VAVLAFWVGTGRGDDHQFFNVSLCLSNSVCQKYNVLDVHMINNFSW